MKKLLLISLIIFYSLLSKAFCEDKINIPDGIWHGNLPVGGMILCEANIYKIIVKNNKVSIHGNDIFGPSANKFNLNENKYENKFFRLNNYTNRFKFTYLKKEKQIKMSFSGACVGEGIFKLKETTNMNTKVLFIEKICKEIGLLDNELLNKCIVTILKNYKDFK